MVKGAVVPHVAAVTLRPPPSYTKQMLPRDSRASPAPTQNIIAALAHSLKTMSNESLLAKVLELCCAFCNSGIDRVTWRLGNIGKSLTCKCTYSGNDPSWQIHELGSPIVKDKATFPMLGLSWAGPRCRLVCTHIRRPRPKTSWDSCAQFFLILNPFFQEIHSKRPFILIS